MQTVSLEPAEWQQLINVLANTTAAPWVVTNPLLMKLGQQLQAQAQSGPPNPDPSSPMIQPGNSQDGEQVFRSNTPYTGRRD